MQKIEALHAAVAQGSLREVQAMLGRAKLALSKVKMPCKKWSNYEFNWVTFCWPRFNLFWLLTADKGIHPALKLTRNQYSEGLPIDGSFPYCRHMKVISFPLKHVWVYGAARVLAPSSMKVLLDQSPCMPYPYWYKPPVPALKSLPMLLKDLS